ncbi:phosphoglycerate mutase [Sediminicurvatus halobius]|uniref:Phosphoglycerate mutase n=1 Tax=Sediminicurvatus halobius TaxID=2182432 RepID=A0A2U2N4F3_9GAMM|nr:phosphoglycerate mutase [Spiribacter halobius]PWG63937.1 phosphoglycerate mutase [Spiribacter halobius]UEX76351.1 phosphoglycerate mutase [Spiribacter halobius]
MARPRLTLLAPGLLGPVPDTLRDAVGDLGPLPGLTRLLARARRTRQAGDDAESLLQAATGGEWAPGGVARAALPGAAEAPLWYRAAPVHLRADRDRLLLFAGAGLYPAPEAAEALAAAFNGLFAEDGLQLVTADDNWLLAAERAPGPDLPPLAEVAGRYLDAWLPTGESSRPWRRLLNEVQMLFHDHPVNRQREAAGLPAVNGLWFWGGGPVATQAPALAGYHGSHPVLRGLAALAEVPADPLPDGVAALPADGDRLVLVDDAESALLGGDAGDWLSAIGRFETAFAAPLMGEAAGRWGAVDVLPGDGWRYRLDAASRWRLWRRRRSLRDRVQRT